MKLPAREVCIGCGACENACTHHAVIMQRNEQGFASPVVDEASCISCKRCIRVCPICTQPRGNSLGSASVYALCSRDNDLRFRSTSGGAFSELAAVILKRGGIAVGAAYTEDFRVSHRIAESLDELEQIRRSKYQQSDMGQIYRQIRNRLKEGREVLFCGTPCQAAGLKNFVGEEEKGKLYLCDFICRGVTSPLVFQEYLGELEKAYQSKAISVWMKHKGMGWRSLSTVVGFANGKQYVRAGAEDAYVQLLISANAGIRPSCYDCRFKGGNSVSDITLGDFWGLEGFEADDNMGTSAVICRTIRGRQLVEKILDNCIWQERTVGDVVRGNPCLISSLEKSTVSEEAFFEDVKRKGFIAAYRSIAGLDFK